MGDVLIIAALAGVLGVVCTGDPRQPCRSPAAVLSRLLGYTLIMLSVFLVLAFAFDRLHG